MRETGIWRTEDMISPKKHFVIFFGIAREKSVLVSLRVTHYYNLAQLRDSLIAQPAKDNSGDR